VEGLLAARTRKRKLPPPPPLLLLPSPLQPMLHPLLDKGSGGVHPSQSQKMVVKSVLQRGVAGGLEKIHNPQNLLMQKGLNPRRRRSAGGLRRQPHEIFQPLYTYPSSIVHYIFFFLLSPDALLSFGSFIYGIPASS
jgi:hypothetical protein